MRSRASNPYVFGGILRTIDVMLNPHLLIHLLSSDFFDTQAIGCAAETGFYETFIMQITIPPLICSLIFMSHKTAKYLDIASFSNPAVVPKYVLFILFFIYPGTSNTILKLLRCKTMSDGSQYLAADFRIRCDSSEPIPIFLGSSTITYRDAYGLAIFMIFVYPIGVPLLFISLLYKNRMLLFDPNGPLDVWGEPTEPDEKLSMKYGQLYTAYDPKRWYWEVIELGRKLILVGACAHFPAGMATFSFLQNARLRSLLCPNLNCRFDLFHYAGHSDTACGRLHLIAGFHYALR